MNWLTVIALIVVAIIIVTTIIGLIFEPGSVMKIAAMPFIILRDISDRLNEFVESALAVTQAYWNSHTQALRAASNKPDSNPTLWFVARLCYLAVALVMIVATGSLDIERANAAQFSNGGGNVNLPANDALLNGVIWFTLILFWGVITCDIYEIIPQHARLLRIENANLKRGLRIITAVGVAVLIPTLALLYYVASLSTHNASWLDATDLLAAAQGALVNFAGFAALMAVIWGFVVIVAVGDGILILALALAHILTTSLAKFWAACTEALVRMIGIEANALRSGWNILARFQIMQNFGAPILSRIIIHDDGVIEIGSYPSQSSQSSSAYTQTSTIYSPPPTGASAGYASANTAGMYAPSGPPIDIGKTVLLAAGSGAVELLNMTVECAQKLNSAAPINAVGMCPLGTPGEKRLALHIPYPGILNLTPLPDREVLAHQRASTAAEVREQLLHDLTENVKGFCLGERPSGGQILLLLTLDNVEFMDAAIDVLRSLTEYQVGVVAVLPRYSNPTLDIGAALATLKRWHGEMSIAGTVLIDYQSPLVGALGAGQQFKLVAQSLASMICAPSSDPDNGAMTVVLKHLGDVAPFIACGIVSGAVSSGKQRAGWDWLSNLFGAPRRGSGNDFDIRKQIHDQFLLLLNESNLWTVGLSGSGIPDDAKNVALITAPFRTTDPRWPTFQELVSNNLTSNAPHTLPLFVNGNGTPDSAWLAREYYAQVTVLAAVDYVTVDKYGALIGEPAPYPYNP